MICQRVETGQGERSSVSFGASYTPTTLGKTLCDESDDHLAACVDHLLANDIRTAILNGLEDTFTSDDMAGDRAWSGHELLRRSLSSMSRRAKVSLERPSWIINPLLISNYRAVSNRIFVIGSFSPTPRFLISVNGQRVQPATTNKTSQFRGPFCVSSSSSS